MRVGVEERFWAKVEKTSTCWLWKASTDSKGYGRFWDGYRILFAHRYSWGLVFDLPENLNVCHKCDVPLCVNPDHLFVGTQKDNIQDMIAKSRDRGRWPDGAASLGGQALAKIRSCRTHCINGHLMDEENTYRPTRGRGNQRQCRICRKEAHARSRLS